MASDKPNNGPKVTQPESGIWLSALANPDSNARDSVVNLFKETQKPTSAVDKAIREAKKAGYKKGAKARLRGDAEVGEVVGFNHVEHGFYSGDRYPILVKFERGTFEYGVDSLELA